MTNLAVALAWTAFAMWSWKIGYHKGHAFAGLVLGATLAYVGVLIIACFPASKTRSRDTLPSGTELTARLPRHRSLSSAPRHVPAHAQHAGRHAA